MSNLAENVLPEHGQNENGSWNVVPLASPVPMLQVEEMPISIVALAHTAGATGVVSSVIDIAGLYAEAEANKRLWVIKTTAITIGGTLTVTPVYYETLADANADTDGDGAVAAVAVGYTGDAFTANAVGVFPSAAIDVIDQMMPYCRLKATWDGSGGTISAKIYLNYVTGALLEV